MINMGDKMKLKDMMLLSNLRANARETLTNISKRTNIPISTIFDRLKLHEKNLIKKHTAIIDFALLGPDLEIFLHIFNEVL